MPHSGCAHHSVWIALEESSSGKLGDLALPAWDRVGHVLQHSRLSVARPVKRRGAIFRAHDGAAATLVAVLEIQKRHNRPTMGCSEQRFALSLSPGVGQHHDAFALA